MKRSESSLLLFMYAIAAGFIIYFFFLSESLDFSTAETKKSFLLFFFVVGVILFGRVTRSISKAFVIFFPMLFQVNKVIFELSDVIQLPLVLDQMQIRIAALILFFAFVILFDYRKLAEYFRFKPVLFYNLFILVGIFTLVWAISINAAISYIPTIIMLPVSYFVFMRFFEMDEKNIWRLNWGLILTALISLIFIWPDYFGIKWFAFLVNESEDTSFKGESVRAGGLVSRAAVALLLCGIIPYIYNFGIYYYKKYRRYVYLTSLILILTLILSLSRMDIIASVLGVGLLSWYMIREGEIKVNVVFLLVGVVFFIGLAYYVVTSNGNSVEEAITRDTWDGRLAQYSAGLSNFTYSYGFGVGMNNYLVSYVSRSVLGANAWNFRSGNTLHSDYFRILGEYGLVGFIFYLLFLFNSLKAKTKTSVAIPMVRGAKINIGILAFAGLTEPALNHDTTLMLCGMYLAIMKYYENKSTSDFLSEMSLKLS